MSKVIGITGHLESNIPTDYVPITPDDGEDLTTENFIGLRVVSAGNVQVEWAESGGFRPVREFEAGEIIIGHVKRVGEDTTAEVDGIKG